MCSQLLEKAQGGFRHRMASQTNWVVTIVFESVCYAINYYPRGAEPSRAVAVIIMNTVLRGAIRRRRLSGMVIVTAAVPLTDCGRMCSAGRL